MMSASVKVSVYDIFGNLKSSDGRYLWSDVLLSSTDGMLVAVLVSTVSWAE